MTLDELNALVLERSIAAGPDAVRALIEEHANRRAEAATITLRAEVERLRAEVDRLADLSEARFEQRQDQEELTTKAEQRADAVTAVARGLVEVAEKCRDGFFYDDPLMHKLRAALARAGAVLDV